MTDNLFVTIKYQNAPDKTIPAYRVDVLPIMGLYVYSTTTQLPQNFPPGTYVSYHVIAQDTVSSIAGILKQGLSQTQLSALYATVNAAPGALLGQLE